MRNVLRLVWMALLLLTVALLSALTAMRLAIHGREVTVPDFQGKTPAEARRIADEIGFATQIEREYYSPTVPRGRVLSQMPAPGVVVRRGWELRLALSLGPQRVAIPQVIGESERAAALSLDERGLDLGSTASLQIPAVPAGQVIAQSPSPNATDVAAPKTSLLIADAPQPQAFVMPSFIGQPLGSVAVTLQKAGFPAPRVSIALSDPNAIAATPPPLISSTPPTPGPQGIANPTAAAVVTSPAAPSPAAMIVSQTPAPGAKVLAGSVVTLVVKD